MSKVKHTNLKNLVLKLSFPKIILMLILLLRINNYHHLDHLRVEAHEKKFMHLNIIRTKFIKIVHES